MCKQLEKQLSYESSLMISPPVTSILMWYVGLAGSLECVLYQYLPSCTHCHQPRQASISHPYTVTFLPASCHFTHRRPNQVWKAYVFADTFLPPMWWQDTHFLCINSGTSLYSPQTISAVLVFSILLHISSREVTSSLKRQKYTPIISCPHYLNVLSSNLHPSRQSTVCSLTGE